MRVFALFGLVFMSVFSGCEVEDQPQHCEPKFNPTHAPLNVCHSDQRVSVTFVGDILLHTQLQKQGFEEGFDSLWGSVSPFFFEADIAVANLEGPVATGVSKTGKVIEDPGPVFDDWVYSSYPMFNYHVSLLEALKDSSIDLVSTANNHSLDRFSIGVDKTIDALDEAGISYTGTIKRGDQRTFSTIVPTSIGSIAFLSCTFSTNGIEDRYGQVLMCYENRQELLEEVADLASDSDVHGVIVLAHWGREYENQPAAKDVALAEDLARAGATAVVGTHPHVIQPWSMVAENRGVIPVIYSTGNFVSGQPSLQRETSMIARIELCRGQAPASEFDSDNLPLIVSDAGWIAARMKADTNRSLRVALSSRRDPFAQESHDLIEQLVPNFSLNPTLRCR